MTIFCSKAITLGVKRSGMNNKRYDEIDLYRELIDQSEQSYDIASIEKGTPDELVCECHVVSFNDLVAFVTEKKCLDLDLICRELKVGTGCHTCLKTCGAWMKKLETVI